MNIWDIYVVVIYFCSPVWLVIKELSVSSVLSVWLKRAMGLAPWNNRMLGTATVPNLVERLAEDENNTRIAVNRLFQELNWAAYLNYWTE